MIVCPYCPVKVFQCLSIGIQTTFWIFTFHMNHSWVEWFLTPFYSCLTLKCRTRFKETGDHSIVFWEWTLMIFFCSVQSLQIRVNVTIKLCTWFCTLFIFWPCLIHHFSSRWFLTSFSTLLLKFALHFWTSVKELRFSSFEWWNFSFPLITNSLLSSLFQICLLIPFLNWFILFFTLIVFLILRSFSTIMKLFMYAFESVAFHFATKIFSMSILLIVFLWYCSHIHHWVFLFTHSIL